MISGTRMDVFEALLERPKSATDIAEELGLSVQSVSHHLKSLEEDNLIVPGGTRAGETRPHELYEANEFARVFAAFDRALIETTVELTPAHKVILATLQIPQPEFHATLISLLFFPTEDYGWNRLKSVAVYGSVARGDADEESDVDVLFIVEDGVDTDDIYTNESMVRIEPPIPEFGNPRLVSESWFTESEVREGLEAGSQFLRSALSEAVILYDSGNILRDITDEYVEAKSG